MNYYTFIDRPKCKTCGRKMNSWNPWATEHEHHHCALIRLEKDVQQSVRNIFNKSSITQEKAKAFDEGMDAIIKRNARMKNYGIYLPSVNPYRQDK